MMNMAKKHLRVLLIVLAILLISGCSASTTSLTVRTWIDAPRMDTNYLLGEQVEVVVHATDQPSGSIKAVALFLGDELLATLPNGDPNAGLVTFNYSFLPPGPGEYVLSAAAQNGGGAWGQAASTTFHVGGSAAALPGDEVLPDTIPDEPIDPTCDDRAQVVAQSLNDGTIFDAGEAFSQAWTLRNAGNCTWDAGYRFVFSAGANFTGATIPVSIGQNVPAGGEVQFSADLVAPANPGNYLWVWQLLDSAGGEVPLDDAGLDAIQAQFIVAAPTAIPPTAVPPTITPVSADTQSPVIVELEWSPVSPNEDQAVSFNVLAQDNQGVTRIEIYFVRDGNPVGSPLHVCEFTPTCEYQKTSGFSWGNYKYFALAYDAAGNQVSSFQQTVQVLQVIK